MKIYKNEFIDDDAQGFLICGSKKELRKAKLLRLLSDKRLVNDYQSKAKSLGTPMDFYEKDKITCGDEPIVGILPERDTNSYIINKNHIEITDKKTFWKLHKIVILIK